MDQRAVGERRTGPRAGRGAKGARGSSRPSGKVLLTSLGISALLHVLVLMLYPLGRAAPSVGVGAPLPAAPRPERGIEVVRIVESETPEPGTPEDPEALEEAAAPGVAAEAPLIAEPAVPPSLVGPGETRAERVRPRLRDRRLWGPPFRPERHELTPEQRAELELAGRLEAYNDSVAAAEAAAAAATDWTVRDGQGRRWGISPGQLHLGDVTIPLPALEWAGGDRQRTAQRIWEWEEIQRQGAQTVVRDSWKERSEAMRARRDAQRRAERPDTSRSR